MSVIGQLPDSLTDEQLQLLDSEVGNPDSIVNRIYRDTQLVYIDPDSYSRSNADIYITNIDYDELYSLLHSTATEYINRTDINKYLIYDLIDPGRIPNDYSAETRSRIRDIFSALYIVDSDRSTGISPYELTMQFRDLGQEGAISTALITQYMGKYPVLIKSASIQFSQHFLHEYLVGLMANTLRADIPNFMYTYGILNDVSVITTGLGTDPAYYFTRSDQSYTIAVEYISSAKSLNNFSPDDEAVLISNNEYYNCTGRTYIVLLLFQIFCSILYAYSKIGFIHRDLHLDNILVVKLSEVTAIPVMMPVSYQWTDDQKSQVNIQLREDGS